MNPESQPMTRGDAEAILLSRMAGAPNLEDYREWLALQPEDIVLDLAQGRVISEWRVRHRWLQKSA